MAEAGWVPEHHPGGPQIAFLAVMAGDGTNFSIQADKDRGKRGEIAGYLSSVPSYHPKSSLDGGDSRDGIGGLW